MTASRGYTSGSSLPLPSLVRVVVVVEDDDDDDDAIWKRGSTSDRRTSLPASFTEDATTR